MKTWSKISLLYDYSITWLIRSRDVCVCVYVYVFECVCVQDESLIMRTWSEINVTLGHEDPLLLLSLASTYLHATYPITANSIPSIKHRRDRALMTAKCQPQAGKRRTMGGHLYTLIPVTATNICHHPMS